MASVPSVPGLNRTQLVSVGIFGEALCTAINPSWMALRCPGSKKSAGTRELWWESRSERFGGLTLPSPKGPRGWR